MYELKYIVQIRSSRSRFLRRKQWYSIIKSTNGEIVWVGELVKNRVDCYKTAKNLVDSMLPGTAVIEQHVL